MKVVEETFVKGKSRKEVITVGKKKFIRVASSSGVDWRRYKTNHQVNQSEFDSLEQEYKKTFPISFSPDPHFNGVNMYASGSTMFHQFVAAKDSLSKAGIIEDDNERRKIERGLVEASKDGTNLLMGVKYVKEQTGWGLREAKDFVDDFFKRSKAFNR
jgi:hypothetical protein